MKEFDALLLMLFAAFATMRCVTAPQPHPITVLVGDADIPLAQRVCSNMTAFCPSSVPDGGEPVCESVVTARYGLTPATMPTVLMCEAQAGDKSTFVKCGGVAVCP